MKLTEITKFTELRVTIQIMLILTMKNYKTGLTVNNLWYLKGDWLSISSEKKLPKNIYNLLMNYVWSWTRKAELSTH